MRYEQTQIQLDAMDALSTACGGDCAGQHLYLRWLERFYSCELQGFWIVKVEFDRDGFHVRSFPAGS
jgi:hypothetical protein